MCPWAAGTPNDGRDAVLVVLSIPLAFSLGPLIIGIIVLAFGIRRVNDGLARPA